MLASQAINKLGKQIKGNVQKSTVREQNTERNRIDSKAWKMREPDTLGVRKFGMGKLRVEKVWVCARDAYIFVYCLNVSEIIIKNLKDARARPDTVGGHSNQFESKV